VDDEVIPLLYVEDAARVVDFAHLGLIGAALYLKETLSRQATAGSDR
jgi:hypothetical protein